MRTLATPPPPPPVDLDDAVGPALAGVYTAKANRLLVGPLLHLQHFTQAPTGSAFGSTRLPAPSSRYVVDCAVHTCDFPLLPRYATASVPTDRSGVSDSSANGARAAATPQPSPLCTPPAAAAPLVTSPFALPAFTHSGAPSLSSRAHSPSPRSPCEAADGHTTSPGRWSILSPPPPPLQRSPAAAAMTVVESLDAAPMSTEKAVARMNSNASDFLAKLRQRCEVNGMAARGVSLVRRVNLVASSVQSSPSRAASSPSEVATVRSYQVSPAYRRLYADPADGFALSLGGSGVAEASSPAAAAADVTPLQLEFSDRSPAMSKPRHQPLSSTAKTTTAAALATNAALLGISADLLRNAELNDEMTEAAKVACGRDHVISCPVPHTADSLDSAAVQAALHRMSDVLASDPDAVVYVYSLDGKGTASAVASLYLVQVEHVSLAEALVQRLPYCTPRMSCLVQLLERDPLPAALDRVAYLRRYLARRHPTASATSIEVAVEACDGDFAKAERLVRSELSFQAVEGVLTGHAAGRRRGGPLSGSMAASSSPLAVKGGSGSGGRSAAPLHIGRAASRVGVSAASTFSISSAGAARGALDLTDGDETIIDSLHAALLEGGVAAARGEVRESYVLHRRAQEMVLRQFLLRLKTSVTLTPPPWPRQSQVDDDATPLTQVLEPMGLPSFAPPPELRQVASTVTTALHVSTPRSRPTKKPQQSQRPVYGKVPVKVAHAGDDGASPAPRRPRVASARTPAARLQPPTPRKSSAVIAAPKAAAAARPAAEKAAGATVPKAKSQTPRKAEVKGRPSS